MFLLTGPFDLFLLSGLIYLLDENETLGTDNDLCSALILLAAAALASIVLPTV